MLMDFARMTGAVSLALLAMSSLMIGVTAGLYLKPSQRVTAGIMAFGAGALIHALSVELAFEGASKLMHGSHMSGPEAWAWVAAGFALGGVIYHAGNKKLEEHGASLRHPALAKLYLENRKREETAGLLALLSRVELLRALPPEEMEDVMVCVRPVRVSGGETGFRRGDEGDALFLLVSGK